ncbi:MAG: hypothetical protein JW882_09965 [Deltaproteobacteria bacterium]|nr:hypothetical protein [Deltaproteobacteria bacterium]
MVKTSPRYDVLAVLLENCEQHMKKNKIPDELWGECEKCKASKTCPNNSKEFKRKLDAS